MDTYLAKYFIKIGVGIERIVNQKSFLVIELDKKYLNILCLFLKFHQCVRYDYLLDIWGVDYPHKNQRFEINYLIVSLKYKLRILLKVKTKQFEGISSLCHIFASSVWLEREVWDMYGVVFYHNIDLRRILTDYGFEGHPLRKDFPLSGFYEVRYDDECKRIVYEPLEIGQEYRFYKFNSPWEVL